MRKIEAQKKTPNNLSEYNYVLMLIWLISKYMEVSTDLPDVVNKYFEHLEHSDDGADKVLDWLDMSRNTFANLIYKLLNIHLLKTGYLTSYPIEDYHMSSLRKEGFDNILSQLSTKSREYINQLSKKIVIDDVGESIDQELSDAIETLVEDDISVIEDIGTEYLFEEGEYYCTYKGQRIKHSDFVEMLKEMHAIPIHPDDWFMSYNDSYMCFANF